MTSTTNRTIDKTIAGIPASDGAGVKLTRSLGSRGQRLDPFLMLDEFFSDDPEDYIAGFPEHPHRGFETITIMLDGRMRHRDHLGNTGDLGPGDVQWMTAARGIIHSEMPQQTNGRMRGFQIWLNLPAHLKMQPAAYQDIPAARIPVHDTTDGARIRVIAGRWTDGATRIDGPVQRPVTEPVLLDITLASGGQFDARLPADHAALVYGCDGEARIAGTQAPTGAASVLTAGGHVRIDAGENGARVLLLAARPLDEPIAAYGPFVMNTRDEIEQALADYRAGTLAA